MPNDGKAQTPKFVIRGQGGVVTWLNDCEHPPLIIEAMHSKL